MSTWGVASPPITKIEGQPIIDMRFEQIAARQITALAKLEELESKLVLMKTQIKLAKEGLSAELDSEGHSIRENIAVIRMMIQQLDIAYIQRIKDERKYFSSQLGDGFGYLNNQILYTRNHFFEYFCSSFKWWLVNVFWPFMKRPLWTSKWG